MVHKSSISSSDASCASAASLFLKGRVHQQIDGRNGPVAGNEALAEIAQKIVVAFLRARGYEVAARLGEFVFHLETWESTENFSHVRRRDQLEAKPAPVEPYAHGAESYFRLLVKRD